MKQVVANRWARKLAAGHLAELILRVALIVSPLTGEHAWGATSQPIEGTWQWLGAVIRVTATGPNTYTGAMQNRGSGEALPCFQVGDVVWNISGSTEPGAPFES